MYQGSQADLEYVGFWSRFGAAIIDTVLIWIITLPILVEVYGDSYLFSNKIGGAEGPIDFLLSWVFPMVGSILFWVTKQATPGKMAISAKIVDATTGERPGTSQLMIRYFGYFVASIPFLLGIIWVAFDGRKQGWHDKLAGTVVVRPKYRGPQPVSFRGEGDR